MNLYVHYVDRAAVKDMQQSTPPKSPKRVPKHSTVAATLIEEICAGRFRPGDLLPTETELGHRFGVSRHTVRVALRSLYEKGLVISQQGRGSVVQTTAVNPRYSYACNSLEDLHHYTEETPRKVLSVARALVDERLAAWLGCAPGYFWWTVRTCRLREADGRVIASSSIYVPDVFADAVAEIRTSSLPLFVLMERRYRHQIVQIRQGFSVSFATADEASDLAVDIGAPVMCVERRFFDERGGLIEVTRSVHPPDVFQFEITMRQVVGPRAAVASRGDDHTYPGDVTALATAGGVATQWHTD